MSAPPSVHVDQLKVVGVDTVEDGVAIRGPGATDQGHAIGFQRGADSGLNGGQVDGGLASGEQRESSHGSTVSAGPSGVNKPAVKPRLLDLFCCEGGASTGYSRAGFDVTGVDIDPRPKYPFPFILADAMAVLNDSAYLDQFDVIAASPPCQMYSTALRHMAHEQPMLIDAVREALQGRTYVIENVPGSDIPPQDDLFGRHGVELCGTQFGLRIYRHRLFDSSIPLSAPPCRHRLQAMNPHNVAGREWIYREFGRQDPEVIWRREMGVEWMSKHGGRESIPPAFTEHIGAQLLTHLAERAA